MADRTSFAPARHRCMLIVFRRHSLYDFHSFSMLFQKLAIFDIIYLPESIERLSNEFPKKLIFFRKTDVSNRLEVDRSFKEIALKFGRLDVLVNNAGLLDERELNLTIDVNLVCIA